MKANNVVTSSTKCVDGEKQIIIETFQIQCGSCNGVFAVEQLFTEGIVGITCPYCKVDVELPQVSSGEMILEHNIGE